MNTVITQRLQDLRNVLRREKIHACIVPSTDPHLGEYIAPHWESRAWLSGFTGSAGTLVVTLDAAGLWTDSRYFLQAETQLAGTGIDLYKEMLPDTPTIIEFLGSRLQAGDSVGIDGRVFAVSEAEKLDAGLKHYQIKLSATFSPLNEIWADRPPVPDNPVVLYDERYAGQSAGDKIETIRRELKAAGCQATMLSALDEIAWTLNLRGSDVRYNPVAVSYLLVTDKEVCYFVPAGKCTDEVVQALARTGVRMAAYEDVEQAMSHLQSESILLDPAKTNVSLLKAVNPKCRIVYSPSPVALLKAVRNETEIAGLRNAMIKEGVVLVRLLLWLEQEVASGRVTELGVERKLQELRAGQPLYRGDAFRTIAGYGEHGAIVHYAATEESDAVVQPQGFLLVDTGGQYEDGTTDTTRTVPVGALTDEERTDFTLVLKGVIALSMIKFPEGTRGAQLDVLARMAMWQHGMNYLHGTGHGVGHYLNVHEGPQSIRQQENPVALRAGMISSVEPGIYKAGRHGVRTENMVLVVDAGEGMFGRYLTFDTVTRCPIDRKAIIKTLLSPQEIAWIDNYHQTVYNDLSPLLSEAERAWLRQVTQPL